MTSDRNQLGRWAEDQAAVYLESAGYQVILRNERLAGVEVDLIAKQAMTMVAVEVKARETFPYASGFSIEQVWSPAQQIRLQRGLHAFLSRTSGDFEGRLDLILILPASSVQDDAPFDSAQPPIAISPTHQLIHFPSVG